MFKKLFLVCVPIFWLSMIAISFGNESKEICIPVDVTGKVGHTLTISMNSDEIIEIPQCWHIDYHVHYYCMACGSDIVLGCPCPNEYCPTNQKLQ